MWVMSICRTRALEITLMFLSLLASFFPLLKGTPFSAPPPAVQEPLSGKSLPAAGTLRALPHPTVGGGCLILQAARLGEVCIMEQVW